MVLLTHHPAFESAVLESSVCQRPLRKIILLFPTRAQILFSCPPSSLRFRGRRPHAELQEEHPDCLIQSWPHMTPAMDMGPYQGNMRGFPGSSVGKESACSSGDLGSIPRSGRAPGAGNGNPLQYSCLGDPMDREAWRATVHGVTTIRHNSVHLTT